MRAQRSNPRLSVLLGLLLFAALPFACGKRNAPEVAVSERAPAIELAQRAP